MLKSNAIPVQLSYLGGSWKCGCKILKLYPCSRYMVYLQILHFVWEVKYLTTGFQFNVYKQCIGTIKKHTSRGEKFTTKTCLVNRLTVHALNMCQNNNCRIYTHDSLNCQRLTHQYLVDKRGSTKFFVKYTFFKDTSQFHMAPLFQAGTLMISRNRCNQPNLTISKLWAKRHKINNSNGHIKFNSNNINSEDLILHNKTCKKKITSRTKIFVIYLPYSKRMHQLA